MPIGGLVVEITGLGVASTPLASIVPQAVPGCFLFVSPDVLTLAVPVAGVRRSALAIPSTVALIGQILHQQVVALELDASANVTALTSSNRVTLTLGTF